MQPSADVDALRIPPKPKLSVVVATLNRVGKLRKCVECLLGQKTQLNFELIVVDNGSTDETSAYLEAIVRKEHTHVQVVTTRERKRGLAAARNSGWKISRGDIVAFTDDDCYAPEDYADSVVQVFDGQPDIGFAAGRILLYDPTDYRITIEESEQTVSFRPFTYIAAGAIHGANMAFRRAALERIGGFDERLGAGTAFPSEDIDAVAAVLWLGIPGTYDPRMMVYHHHGRKAGTDVKALNRGYDAGRGAYFAKYILRRESRAEYLKAFARSAKDDWNAARKLRSFPGRTVREAWAAMRFVLQRNGRR
jgi:glycosyltransferase involved in cell wall biosynthesis